MKLGRGARIAARRREPASPCRAGAGLRSRLNELEQRLREQQDAERQLAEFCKRRGKRYDIDDLETLHQELEARIASLADSVSNAQEQRMTLRRAGAAAVAHSDADAPGAGLAGGAEQP